jgi:hypothetical protein
VLGSGYGADGQWSVGQWSVVSGQRSRGRRDRGQWSWSAVSGRGRVGRVGRSVVSAQLTSAWHCNGNLNWPLTSDLLTLTTDHCL